MTLTLRLSLLVPLVFVAGCAVAPQVPPPAPAPDEVAIIVTPLQLEPIPSVAVARTLADPAPFTPLAAAELEPLPPPADDLWVRIREGFRLPDLDDPLVAKWEQWYSSRPGLRRADGRSQPALPLLHRRSRSSSAECRSRSRCCRWSRARSTRSRCRSARASGIWQFMPVDRQALRAQAELLVRLPARRDRRDRQRAQLPAEAPRRVRRLAAGAGRLQLGRRQRRPGHREEPEGGPADRLREPQDARRDAQLPAQAAGGEEHRPRPREVRPRPRRHPGRAVFRRGQDRPQDRREAWPPSSPRCRSTSSSTSIRSTIGRSSPAPTNTRSCCRSTRRSSSPPSSN